MMADQSAVFWKIGWRYLQHHLWQSLLMVIGVTIGVAVVVAIDLANASASRAFDISTDAIVGRATHQVVGGPQGLDDAVYTRLVRRGVIDAAAPVITEFVFSPQIDDRPLQLLGVDPFAEAPFRSYLSSQGEVPIDRLIEFFTRPGAVILSTDLADRYGLRAGDTLELDVLGYHHQAVIVGLLTPADRLSGRALEGILLADIATAQEITGRLGRVDRIDLILPAMGSEQMDAINAELPASARLVPVAARKGTIEQMTAAFHTNLTALSLLALVVGMFLIYNTMTFSIVQRREMFGTLRCLGVTRREIFALVVSEALIVGLLSAGFGLLVGIFLGQGAVNLVTQTINDLYFVVTVRGVHIPPGSLLKGAIIGIVATIVSALAPAWEAASVPPREAISRSSLESKARRALKYGSITGVIIIAVGAGFLAYPSRDLPISFTGTLAVVIGFAFLTPAATVLLMRAFTPFYGYVWGTVGKMATREVEASLSRTAIAVAALMVAISVIIGVNLMVGSFRFTVVAWLAQTLQGDIYLSPTSPTATLNSRTLDPDVLDALHGWPGIQQVDTVRSVQVDSADGVVNIAAVNNPATGNERLLKWVKGDPDAVWQTMQTGAVLLSEPLANRIGVSPEDRTISLVSDAGAREFPIAGVYFDYASSQGTVLMADNIYREFWNDSGTTAAALKLAAGAQPDEVVSALRAALASIQTLNIQPNRALRDEVLAVFDRTFAITRALQLLATIVAFIGVLSALLSLQLEKQRLLGILRSMGLTVRQLWGLVILETGLMGLVAGLMAIPTGFVLSAILIFIINRRSFGWTLQMKLEPDPFLQAITISVLAALIAGIYPAIKFGRTVTAEALRFE